MYGIMNLDRFILEVPAELQMRRKQRKKDGIMNLDRFILEVPAELQVCRKQRRHRIAFTPNYGQCKERKE
jgi:hypothetical protein